MQIWVDADACPREIKEILYRAANRCQRPLILVANKWLQVPRSEWIKSLQVESGFDVADGEILNRLAPGDLVITSDIPLASEVLKKGGHALSPRGEWFSPEDIEARLTLRNFYDNLRGSGIVTEGPSAMNQGDRQAFSNHLDRFLRKRK